jgi:hypothetical protein
LVGEKGKMAEEQTLSPSGPMNKSLDDIEDPIFRNPKDRKSTKEQKRVTGYLKNTSNQKDIETGCRASSSYPSGKEKPRPSP